MIGIPDGVFLHPRLGGAHYETANPMGGKASNFRHIRRGAACPGAITFHALAIALAIGVFGIAGCDEREPPPVVSINPEGNPRHATRYPFDSCGGSAPHISWVPVAGEVQCEDRAAGWDLLAALVQGEKFDAKRKVQFWRACQAHDICYWTPGRSKRECDEAFLANLKRECNDAFPRHGLMGACRLGCAIWIGEYYYGGALTPESRDSYAEAQAEAYHVMTNLTGRTLPGDTTSGVTAESLVGEGCFWMNDKGKCTVTDVIAWLEKGAPGSQRKAEAMMNVDPAE